MCSQKLVKLYFTRFWLVISENLFNTDSKGLSIKKKSNICKSNLHRNTW